MKINMSQQYIPYGPAGHPEAGLFKMHMGSDKDEVEGSFYSWIEKYQSQNTVPTTFYDGSKTLEENGYFILPVQGDEVSDDLIAALAVPKMFTPAGPWESGRKLQDFKSHLPRFYHHFDFEVWFEGTAGCAHDFGLESYAIKLRENYTDRILDDDDILKPENKYVDGVFFATVKCSRCGAVHALEERT